VRPVGSCCLVLHSHLPWLSGHGSWPVGEEWLYQAWSQSYLPVTQLIGRLAAEGRRDLLTLGVTPVLAAQLDDSYTLRQMHTWLGFWQLRAEGLAGRREDTLRELAGYEFSRATAALADFEQHWRHGGSPVLRALADSGAVQLLGGPLTHAFQPLLRDPVARFALNAGLDDHGLRFGVRPGGIWAPECGYRPGLEQLYATAGVTSFLVDGPTLRTAGRTTAAAWTVADTDVVVFARDEELTHRVWSPESGYPTGPDYRDFHTYDHPSGIKPARVTSAATAPDAKAPYDPDQARSAAIRDADQFVTRVRDRLGALAAELGRPGLTVVAVDTELFGHWWHEGPVFLEHVLRRLPEAGVQLTTLHGAAAAGHVGGRVDLGPGTWGTGNDDRTWAGQQVADLVDLGGRIQEDLLAAMDEPDADGRARRPDLDQLAREAMLTLSSDWAFMVSNDNAADYARARAFGHAAAFDTAKATVVPDAAPAGRRPFPHLDARQLTAVPR
jgi:1,4-alpha-glucan branching enzyme